MEWYLPNNVNIRYEEGGNNIFDSYIQTGYPLPENNSNLDSYSQLRYAIKLEQGYPEYIDMLVSDEDDWDNLSQGNPRNNDKLWFTLNLSVKNLQYLPYTEVKTKIVYQLFGTKNSVEELVEEKFSEISLLKIANDATKNILANKDVYSMIYSAENTGNANHFTGDQLITIPNLNGKTPTFQIQETSDPIGLEIIPAGTINTFKIEKKLDIDTLYEDPILEPYVYNIDLMIDDKVYDKFQIKVTFVNSPESFLNSNYSLDYNFALDPVFIKIFKSDVKVDRVRMKLAMKFNYLDEDPQDLEEVYEYMMLTDDIKIYPGEEIQDFFKKLQTSNLEESEFMSIPSTFNTVTPKPVFKICDTNIEIIEYDSSWKNYKTYTFSELKWLPGKKPKAFPYLTNGTLRRSYNNGIVSVCAMQQDFIKDGLQKLASPMSNNMKINDYKNWVVQINFSREKANHNYGKHTIIKHKDIQLEPMPEPDKVFSVIFENQNLCPDWFMFAEEYQIETSLNHVLTQNLSLGRKFKANVTSDKRLKLNTGWFFKEELPVLEELMKAGRCFVKTTEHEWLECVPVSKKPLKFDSGRNLHQQIVEFEIIQNER